MLFLLNVLSLRAQTTSVEDLGSASFLRVIAKGHNKDACLGTSLFHEQAGFTILKTAAL